MSDPAIIEVVASMDAVRTTLLSLGATSPDRRSVAFQLGDHLLLLGADEAAGSTVIAVGGDTPGRLAHWLADELCELLPGTIRTLPDSAPGDLDPTG
jgi:hypothetical protein